MTIPLASVRPPDAATSSASGTPPAPGWQLGPNAPQTHQRWLRALGLFLLTRAGWRLDGQMPNVPRYVVVVAPHTSNWDFFVGMAAKWALGFDSHWWGKQSLFTPPMGWFMRANGGIPVERKNRHNAVERTIAAFLAHERFALTLAPEGTRRKVTQWRSGFWHVAKGAGVPICCVALDWERKVVQMGPTTDAREDDPVLGIARIRGYFANIKGRDPTQ